jgi:hypothetical protein
VAELAGGVALAQQPLDGGEALGDPAPVPSAQGGIVEAEVGQERILDALVVQRLDVAGHQRH